MRTFFASILIGTLLFAIASAAPPKALVGPQLTDEGLMDLVQRQTFRYFWDHAHPHSGLARERSGSGNLVTSGGSGFGVMALMVGVKRGYVTREQAVGRLLQLVRFLRDEATRHHGAWPHWMNGRTGETRAFSEFDDGGDIVETAFLIQGLLAARQAFDRDDATETELRSIITQLWEGVEWDWYARGGDTIYWHWSPNHEWKMNLRVRGYNECMMVYLLAVASPTHPVPPSAYHKGWAHPGYQKRLQLNWPDNPGHALFLTHYSHLGMTPHFADAHIAKTTYHSYHERNREQTLFNRRFCVEQREKFPAYGASCWGLTSSQDPDLGYAHHAPSKDRDNGTIAPTAAISSIIYTPEESLAAMRHFYEVHGPRGLWGDYGFKDAFNPGKGWISEGYLAIDQGPIIIMIENHRSGFLWKNFMKDPDVQRMIKKLELKFTR